MTSSDFGELRDPVLEELGVAHGFGTKTSQVPELTAFPRQVHGVAVARAAIWAPDDAPAADAILSSGEAPSVGIVTADCVPILLSSSDATHVAAIHAGWRGLAAGVIEAALAAFLASLGRRQGQSGQDLGPEQWRAAIGPAVRACCYEVDAPVHDALTRRYAHQLDEEVLSPGREDHYQLDLPVLASRILRENAADSTRIGTYHRKCTVCDAERFESVRRDAGAAGRMRHFIVARKPHFGEG